LLNYISPQLFTNLSKTLVCLAGKLLGMPPRSDSLESLSFGHTDRVDHLVLGEDSVDGDLLRMTVIVNLAHLLLKMVASPVNFLGDSASIDLNLNDVRLLLAVLEKLLLKPNALALATIAIHSLLCLLDSEGRQQWTGLIPH